MQNRSASDVVRPAARAARGAGRAALVGLALSLIAGCEDDNFIGGVVRTSTRTSAATATATVTGAASATVAQTATSAVGTATATRSVAVTATPTGTPTGTAAATITATGTPTGTSAATTTPTGAPPTPTGTPNGTPSVTPTGGPMASNPTVEGPITGPGNFLIQSTSFDLSTVGYAEAEYFVAGTASAYANVGEFGADGVWAATPASSAPFKTRIVVYRPSDPQNFNGSVIVEWLNVSGGLDASPDWTSTHTELIRSGYAWVGVSVQAVGIGPRQGGGPITGLPDLTLKGFNPARYGTLSHPGDSFSYDIFSQVGQAIRHPIGVDPLGGLSRERVIAVGESQSAFRLVTYVNAIHPLVGVFDGFLIHSRGGSGAALSQVPQPAIGAPSVAHIRGDLTVPVLVFETETDLITLRYLPDRQDDAALFRLWEVAGTSHADTYTLTVGSTDKGDSPDVANILVTTSPIPNIIVCDTPINSGPQHWVLKAALAALDRWVRGGDAPATAPRLEIAGDPAAYVLDDLGNVRGGIRTPYVDAPIAKLSGLGQSGGSFCGIFGTTVCFDDATRTALYPTPDDYATAVNESTDAAVAAGFILEPDGALIKAAAAASGVCH